MNSRLFFTLPYVLLMSILFSTFSYASCTSYSSVDVSQEGLRTNYNSSTSIFYVKGNTITSPVRFDFNFESSSQCVQNYSLQSELTSLQDPSSVVFDSENNNTIVSFVVNTLQIETFNVLRLFHSENTFMKQFQLRKDEINPSITLHLLDSQGMSIPSVVSSGTNITLKIEVNDVIGGYGSDVDSISIGSLEFVNGFEFNTSVSGSQKPGSFEFESQALTSRNFLVEVRDKLGNSAQESIFIEVDSSDPLVTGYSDQGVFFDSGLRKYSFFVEVSDSSFDSTTGPQEVRAVISPTGMLTPSNLQTNDCRFIIDSKYVCHFDNIQVEAPTTSLITIIVSAQDSLGNEGFEIFSGKEIFIDSQPPVVEEFYFENSFGGLNIVSPSANGSITLYLKYFDDSELDSGRALTKYFDEIELPSRNEGNCGEGCNFWNFSTGLSDSNFDNYLSMNNERAIFRVILRDEYDYTTEVNQTLIFDRYVPKILNSSFVEGDETCQGSTIVRDSLIQSCEEFDVRVVVHELEERFEEDLTILGNFSQVSTRDSLLSPSCDIDNLGDDLLEYDCVFENLEAAQGYLNETYTIIVQDSAGNIATKNFSLEILNASYDSTIPRYDINDLTVLAPLSRVLLDQQEGQGQVIAWFEGEIRDKIVNEGITIVNYKLLSCQDFEVEISDDFSADTLRVENPSLYPVNTETIFTAENPLEGVDKNFVMSFIVDQFENPSLLNDMQTDCTMAVLYRDATTIYEPPQLINFSVEVEFYDLPRGHLLRAHAESLKDDLEDIEKIEEYFGGAYDTYETFAEICNAVNNVCTVSSTASNIITAVSNGLFTTGFGAGFAETLSNTENHGLGFMQTLCSDETSYIKQACDWVTCEKVLLNGVKEFFEELQFDMSFATCSAINNPAGFFGSGNVGSTNLEEVPAP